MLHSLSLMCFNSEIHMSLTKKKKKTRFKPEQNGHQLIPLFSQLLSVDSATLKLALFKIVSNIFFFRIRIVKLRFENCPCVVKCYYFVIIMQVYYLFSPNR